MTTIIGFDVAKDNLVGTRIDHCGRIKEDFEIVNQPRDIDNCLGRLLAKHRHLLIASEATGDYHVTLAKECLKRQIDFRLINPIITKQFIRATVRKKKTDLSDALIIAKLARQGEGTIVSPASFSSAKTIQRTALKLTKLGQILSLVSQRFATVLPEEKELKRKLNLCLKVINSGSDLFRQRAGCRVDRRLSRLLRTIPGIGPKIVVTLITEIGDINRFKSAKALVAYSGLDPRVKQSGASLKHNTHITKRGSPFLRRDIFIAATIAVKWDHELGLYYQKKRNEGKGYREAVVAVSRKLINRIYAVWKRKTPYSPHPIVKITT